MDKMHRDGTDYVLLQTYIIRADWLMQDCHHRARVDLIDGWKGRSCCERRDLRSSSLLDVSAKVGFARVLPLNFVPVILYSDLG